MKTQTIDKQIKWDWMQTYTGKRFTVGNPNPDDIDIVDIAHSLSMQCRYNGHCDKFYSVAEHCVHLYEAAQPEDKLWALLHDATEAYLCDIPTPVKPLLKGYKDIERNLMAMIAKKYGLSEKMPETVHWLDTVILTDEIIQNLNMKDMDHWYEKPRLGITIHNWTPQQAEREFLERFNEAVSYK